VRRKKRSVRRRFFKRLTQMILIVLIFYFGKQFMEKLPYIIDHGKTPNPITMEEKNGSKGGKESPALTPEPTFDASQLNGEVSDEVIGSLEAMASRDPQVMSVLQNSAQYPPKLLEALSNNPELLSYTLNYPQKKGTWEDNINLSGQYKPGKIPLLIQWDEDWGYAPYGPGTIALNGCGPTCLSMVTVGLTGNTSWNPKAVCAFSETNGYLDEQSGSTLWSLMTDGARKLGLHSTELSLDEDRMVQELSQGHPIICSMRPGDFTTKGHFIVLYGYRNGKFLVRDPNSRRNSKKLWSYRKLEPQIKNLWAFSS